MAFSSEYTLLSLDRYAKIMGVDPVRFSGANPITLADNSRLFNPSVDVQDKWPQFSYQDGNSISREDLAREIRNAEEDIARFLNYWPAPVWRSQEMHVYPKYHRPDIFGTGIGIDGRYKEIRAEFGKFIAAGRRAVSLCGDSVAVVYSDEDGDGWQETATITYDASDCGATACELKVYFEDEGGAQEWEIREPRTKTLSGGIFTATYYTWQLIDPDRILYFPTNEESDSATSIDISSPPTNCIAAVDIYREYTDFTEPSALFYWEDLPRGLIPFTGDSFCSSCNGDGCAACELSTQNGCIHFRDVDNGLVVPVPATYDEDNAQWGQVTWSQCREPDSVKIWYYAGEVQEPYRRGASCEPLSMYYADIIAKLATARLECHFLANNNVQGLQRDYMTDRSASQQNISFNLSDEDLSNPFGTRGGELYAYRRLKHLLKNAPPRVGFMA